MAHSIPGDPSAEPHLRIVAWLVWLEKWALWAAALVAAGILCLWALPAVAKLAPPGWSQMTANAALGLLLVAASLALSAPLRSPLALRLARVAAYAALALGGFTLAEYLSPLSGIDQWLPVDASATHPGRMSPQTAAGLALLGVCVLLADQCGNRLAALADAAAIALIALDLVLIGGHVFWAIEIVGIDGSNLTSPQTLFCLVLLALVVAARRAARGGPLSFWISRGIGSHIARVVLPGIVLVPFLLFALIRFLDISDLVRTPYTRALVTPAVVLSALALVAWMGRRTNRLERDLRVQSLTDQLTNVFNRRGFYVVADYAIRNAARAKSGMVLFYFDLDGLKGVNDGLGHEAGSELIKRFAAVLVMSFRNNDVVGRIGGDEFVVLAANTTGTAEFMLERLARNMAASNELAPATREISYSVGYADVAPLAEAAIDDLIAEADAMMYAQKSNKRTDAISGAA